MDEKEIISNMKEFENKYKEDRGIILNSVEKIYSELNHSELVVATGAFALILNFLIGSRNFEYLILLHIGISLLALTIIIKSLSHRRKADIIEKEIDIADEKADLRGNFFIILHKINKGVKSSQKEDVFLSEYFDNLKKINNKLKNLIDKKTSKALNEIEYYAYLSGIIFILGFFILNTLR